MALASSTVKYPASQNTSQNSASPSCVTPGIISRIKLFDVLLPGILVLLRNRMRPEEGGHNLQLGLSAQGSDRTQDLQLVLRAQSVAALGLDGRSPVFEELPEVAFGPAYQ